MVAKEGAQSPVLLHQKTKEETNHKTKTKVMTRQASTRHDHRKRRQEHDKRQIKARRGNGKTRQDKTITRKDPRQDKTCVCVVPAQCLSGEDSPTRSCKNGGTRQRPRGSVWIRIMIRVRVSLRVKVRAG